MVLEIADVSIIKYDGDVAYCSINRGDADNCWYPLQLKRKDLEGCDLVEGDTFKWKVNSEYRVLRGDLLPSIKRKSLINKIEGDGEVSPKESYVWN